MKVTITDTGRQAEIVSSNNRTGMYIVTFDGDNLFKRRLFRGSELTATCETCGGPLWAADPRDYPDWPNDEPHFVHGSIASVMACGAAAAVQATAEASK